MLGDGLSMDQPPNSGEEAGTPRMSSACIVRNHLQQP